MARNAGDKSECIRLAAVGDLLLVAEPASLAATRDAAAALAGVREVLAGCDIVLGNLECTLAGDGRTVPTEPRVVATPEMVRAIRPAGFNVVTLANNHTFDCFQAGFHRLRGLLDELGIAYFGAGDNLEQAAAPAIIEARGLRVAFLGAADRRSGAGPFAVEGRWGVAPLDVDRLARQVRELRDHVHHVMICPHWGEERLNIPAPDQVEQARRLIDAGASMVLGHHPHVLQGLEFHAGRPILYSLGNFLASEVLYHDGDRVRWNRIERTGCILTAALTAGGVEGVAQIPTFDDGLAVRPVTRNFGRRIEKVNRALARGVTLRRYRRQHLWVKTVRPVLGHLRWSELNRLRLRKLGKAVSLLLHSHKAR